MILPWPETFRRVFFLLGVLLGVCWGWLLFVVVDVAALDVILGGRPGR
jgi:hypothetical protein